MHALACLEVLPDNYADKVSDATLQDNVFKEERGCRTYSQVQKVAEIQLLPCVYMDTVPTGKFLLHCESGGLPHCVSVQREAVGRPVTVWDQDQSWTVADMDFQACLYSGHDSGTAVFFLLEAAADAKQAASSLLTGEDAVQLLDLAAGASDEPLLTSDPDDEADIPAQPSDGDDLERAGPCTWLDEEGKVTVDTLLQQLEAEIQRHVKAVKEGRASTRAGLYQCPACPFRGFDRPLRLSQHLQTYHAAKVQFCCSGKKQLRIILSLHDSDMLARRAGGKYLLRSAALMRSSINPPLSACNNKVDKCIRLVLDGKGPRIVNLVALRTHVQARRVGNIWYTRSFAERL